MGIVTRHRKTKKRYHRRRDERQEGHLPPAGLAGLQQSVGNRAVQRMVGQEQEAKQQAVREQALKKHIVYEKAREAAGLLEPDEVVDQADRELLSGEHWADKFPFSDKLVDLDSSFGEDVSRFITALEGAGASVDIISTWWPPERAYLMHFAWLIANEMIDPRQVPPIDEVDFDTDVDTELDIIWWHGNPDDSQTAAENMLKAFGIDELEEPPVLASKHVAGEAIDMHITWGGEGLKIKVPNGDEVDVVGGPHDETNPELMALGAAFNVIHYGDPDEDAVHWSVDGS